MNKTLAILAFCATTLSPTSTRALNSNELLNLSLRDLAHRALGEAGTLMMDVSRPQSVHGELTFFSRATPTGSQYGICASTWVSLYIDDSQAIESLRSEQRFGVEADLYLKDWSNAEYREVCAAAKSVRSYFPAPGGQSALEIATYLDAIAGKGPSQPQAYTFECTGACGDGDYGRNYIRNIELGNITASALIDCERVSAYDRCFELRLTGKPAGVFPRSLRIYGTYRNRDKVIVSRVKLWIGTTEF